MTNPGPVDPAHIVEVVDYSEATLRGILAHLEVSREFSHFVYREAELDTLLRLVTADIAQARPGESSPPSFRLELLLQHVVEAHNFVGERRPEAAAQTLRRALADEHDRT